MEKAVKTIEINTSIDNCYNTICDFESYPEWQKAIKSTTVVDRDTEGRPEIVSFEINVVMKTINYDLRYQYDNASGDKRLLTWTYVGGDIKNIEGTYTFEKKNDNITTATLNLEVDFGLRVPGMIMNQLKNITMADSIKALKKRSEKLYS